jgi:hypothetical protein
VSNTNQQILQRYAQPIFVSSSKNDTNKPFTFKEWYDSHRGITPDQEFKQYNEYLVNWYKNKSQTVSDSRLQLKLNYLSLLKQLQLFFNKEESENWYNKVNVENEKELLLAIPYFAKKLKDISLYYLQLRKAIKETKLKYNQVGTSNSLIQQIQEIIAKNYAQKNNNSINLPARIWNTLPQLSSLNTNLAIQLEELYDFHSYFDQTPTLPASAYFDTNSEDLKNFLHTKNLSLTSAEWIYKLGTFSLSGDEYEGDDISDFIKALSEKYMGEDKFIFSETPTQSAATDFFSLFIQEGNNSFFWPGTVYESKALLLPRYNKVLLSELGLETLGTAGSSIELADTIFVKTDNGVEAAWLRNYFSDYKKETMKAIIDPSTKTSFRFPFPGYGLSGEDIEWTGFSLESDKRYQYLDDASKQNIENVYWSSSTALSSIKSLPINETTLVKNNAKAHKNYNHADQIKVWDYAPNYNDSSVPDVISEAWLYRFDKTDISVNAGSDNVIFWPYEQIDTSKEFPNYYPKALSDVCTSMAVSSIDFVFATAGESLSSSDVIFKIKNYKFGTEDATECCWLSGSKIEVPEEKIRFIEQETLQLVLSSGEFTQFIWSGNDLTDADTVFKSIAHQPDCAFKTTQYVSYLDHPKCTCSQVNYSPFGHPGNVYEENKSLADFIIEDNFAPESLDLSIWKDDYNTTTTSSSSFGWYKTSSDIGWGSGSWYSGDSETGNKFYLRKGKKYIYHRANVTDLDPETNSLPRYIVRHKYNNKNKPTWVHAKKDSEGIWVSTDKPSPMILNPGDLLIYAKTDSTYYSLTGEVTEEIDISENKGSIWSNYDYLTIGENKNVIVSYPVTLYSPFSNLKQYPKVDITNIIKIVNWRITAPDQTVSNFKNQVSINFTPSLTGVYSISVTAVSGDPSLFTRFGAYALSGYYIFNDIPSITAIPTTTTFESITSYNTPIPGYVINVPLNGWDYNTNIFNPYGKKVNQGAKPFWAKTYTEKNASTGYKGVEATGNALRIQNEYNIISQPEFSDIELTLGTKIQYKRNYPVKMNWIQPLDFEVYVNENKWCTLEFNTSAESNLSNLLYNDSTELIVTPTSADSKISITNIVNNQPVEIIYNALDTFVWDISVTPEISKTISNNVSAALGIESILPWTNLSNLNYPTVATIPSVDNLYSTQEIGGYFTPSNLGASIYTNQNYTTSLQTSSLSAQNYFEDTSKRYKGRGLTKEDSNTPYDLKAENNLWLKESIVSGSIAGNTKKNIFKKYQKFLPYQSAYESNPRLKVGLITPTSKQTPWAGKEDSEWGDPANYPISFTGELKVSKWVDAQALKNAGLQADNWVTDIFGNQYALYKNIKNVSPTERKNVNGQIWTRKNSQFVSPANLSLEKVFDTYSTTNLIYQLTGTGVRKIDVFFDTLMVETSGGIIFEKIIYDYPNDNIFSLTDEARFISLAMPVSINLDREFNNTNLTNYTFAKAGETWFFPNEKLVTISVCGLKEKQITPELYRLNLSNVTLEKIFPVLDQDITTISSLSSENIIEINAPVLSFNSFKNEYLMNILCKTENNQSLILEMVIKNDSRLYLKDFVIYKSNPDNLSNNPPVIHHSLHTNGQLEQSVYFQCQSQNGPATYQAVNLPSWLNLSTTGLFTGIPISVGTHEAHFTVSNSFGVVYYTLFIYVTAASYYLYTTGYGTGNGFLITEPETGTEQYRIILLV